MPDPIVDRQGRPVTPRLRPGAPIAVLTAADRTFVDRLDVDYESGPHRLCDNALLLFKAVPELGLIFAGAKTVPASHIDDETAGVRCVCGAATEVPHGHVVECVGYCGRHFLRVAGEIRAARLGSTEHVDLDAERAA